jgi:hypothetical protein
MTLGFRRGEARHCKAGVGKILQLYNECDGYGWEGSWQEQQQQQEQQQHGASVMDLLAGYESDSDVNAPDGRTAAAEYDHRAGHETAAQQRLAESADQEPTQHTKRPRLNTL